MKYFISVIVIDLIFNRCETTTTTIVVLPYFGPLKILYKMKSSMMNVAQHGNFHRFQLIFLSLSNAQYLDFYINETIRKVHLNRLNS